MRKDNNPINANGIDFTSEDYDQRYFDRKRNARREKKLVVGAHLKLLFRYDLVVSDQELRDRFGDGYQKRFDFEDAIIELSYQDEACKVPRQDYWLGFMSSRPGEDGAYQTATFWEVQAPDRETYEGITQAIIKGLEGLVPHQGWSEDLPSFING